MVVSRMVQKGGHVLEDTWWVVKIQGSHSLHLSFLQIVKMATICAEWRSMQQDERRQPIHYLFNIFVILHFEQKLLVVDRLSFEQVKRVLGSLNL